MCIEARKGKQSEKKEKAICNEQMALLAEVIAETALTSSSSSSSSELYVHYVVPWVGGDREVPYQRAGTAEGREGGLVGGGGGGEPKGRWARAGSGAVSVDAGAGSLWRPTVSISERGRLTHLDFLNLSCLVAV